LTAVKKVQAGAGSVFIPKKPPKKRPTVTVFYKEGKRSGGGRTRRLCRRRAYVKQKGFEVVTGGEGGKGIMEDRIV